ncbi:hypothetical protein AU252_05325 [Pseudarthrobacter sulfonivorans]|uniref:Uncharacterized protein n=1 Tax=Pseudarthrobacter sulfonivorans TaxID=121292 RepID=A0A0U3QK32_9MICC|nr:hypothetical protein [Pseudarthrobacter sulfonivorans]ALV40660.1 hypothetical protein AU252_05325 [Pseudarthrobacter sulfonivorans]
MKRTKQGPELTDNYAQFVEQLTAASKKLQARHDSLNRTLEIVTLLFKQNVLGLSLWEERRIKLSKLVAKDAISMDTANSLRELHDVALRMESMFLLRSQRIDEKKSAVSSHVDEINKSLLDLDRSKLNLLSSRMTMRDREKLNEAVAGVAGTPQGANAASSDPGLRDDLNEARRAMILAEALLELKGK